MAIERQCYSNRLPLHGILFHCPEAMVDTSQRLRVYMVESLEDDGQNFITQKCANKDINRRDRYWRYLPRRLLDIQCWRYWAPGRCCDLSIFAAKPQSEELERQDLNDLPPFV